MQGESDMSDIAFLLIFLSFFVGFGTGISEGKRQMFETLKGKLREAVPNV